MSQTSKVLKMLRKAGSKGVPNYKFPAAKILRYSARIGELRSEGYNIYAERVLMRNGRASNVFKYILIEEDE